MKTRTFAMIKPGLPVSTFKEFFGIGTVISFIERRGLQVVELQMKRFTPEDVDIFYQEHVGKHFYEAMKAYMCSGPVVGMILEMESADDENAIAHWRYCLGATDSAKADPYSLRGQFGNKEGIMFKNVAHGSDSPEAFERESTFFFGTREAPVSFSLSG